MKAYVKINARPRRPTEHQRNTVALNFLRLSAVKSHGITRHSQLIFNSQCHTKDRHSPKKNVANHIVLNKQIGVTLIELIITIVVLGIALSALVSALSTGISNSALPLLESKALELSQAYLDEIQAMRFDENSPIGGGELASGAIACNAAAFNDGESRSAFDDVDDYNGLSDAPPVLIDSTISMTEYAGYSVTAQVSCAGTELGLANNSAAKRITLTITLPNNSLRRVAFYKGNF